MKTSSRHRPRREAGRLQPGFRATIACDFGQEVVIEGVESAEMLAQVRELGATLIQGYWFAKPMAAAEVSEWKREFEHRTVTVQDVPTYP